MADLLRVKERKVYDLAASGDIPHRRITGKLLFPRTEIEHWLSGMRGKGHERPAVLSGSHDPLLDWAVRESGSGLAMMVNGSGGGLESYVAGHACLTGLHLIGEGGEWNVPAVAALGVADAVLIGWAARRRGLILGPDATGVRGRRRLGRPTRGTPPAGGRWGQTAR